MLSNRYMLPVAGFFLLALCALSPAKGQIVDERQGCCSYHGGVCGCGCCDGTPLSDICAPYYPGCHGGGTPQTPYHLQIRSLSNADVGLSWFQDGQDPQGFR